MSDIVSAKMSKVMDDALAASLDVSPADEIQSLRQRVERLEGALREANETIVAFAGPWATKYARDIDLPLGHLHPTHYDILEKAGGRMDAFTRASLSPKGQEGE